MSFHISTISTLPPKASITLMRGRELVTQEASGDGPVDALYNAINRIVGLTPSLADYAIKAVTGGTDAVAEATVKVRDGDGLFIGRGTSTDVIEASTKAYLVAVNRIVHERQHWMTEDSVRYLKGRGLEVIYDAEHYFDGWKANPEYALATLAAARRGGADVVVLCDTNGGSLPFDIRDGVKAAQGAQGAGPLGIHAAASQGAGPLGIHTHNDSDVGVANAIVAVRAGAVHVQGTINGIGERCGNANLISLIPNLQLKLRYECVPAASLRRLGELSRIVSELANMAPNEYQAFVGKNAFAHT